MSSTSNDNRCAICGGINLKPLLYQNGFLIARCIACDTQQVSPIPSDEVLKAHYQQSSYFHGDSSQGYEDYDEIHRVSITALSAPAESV